MYNIAVLHCTGCVYPLEIHTHIRDQLFTKNHFFEIALLYSTWKSTWTLSGVAMQWLPMEFSPSLYREAYFFLFFYSRQFCVPSWQAINRQEKMLRDAAELFCSTQYTILDVLTLHLQDNKILSNGRQGQSLIWILIAHKFSASSEILYRTQTWKWQIIYLPNEKHVRALIDQK